MPMTKQTDKQTDRLLENPCTSVEMDFINIWVEISYNKCLIPYV